MAKLHAKIKSEDGFSREIRSGEPIQACIESWGTHIYVTMDPDGAASVRVERNHETLQEIDIEGEGV